MAARKNSAKGDDVAEDLDEGTEDEALEETSLDEAFAEEGDDLDAGPDLDDDPVELTADPVDAGGEDDATGEVATSADAAFDDDADEEGIVAAVTGDGDDQEIEGLRDGEFVCRSCYMAKRDTQLADPEHLLCRDCA